MNTVPTLDLRVAVLSYNNMSVPARDPAVDQGAPPTISVVVVTWNRRELLQACLASLSRQTHPSYEVVVVDNGSTDGSVEMVRALALSYPVPLRLIANPSNLGFCAANNQGFAASRSEMVALLNNDAEAEPGWLEALEAAIRLHPDVGMAASKILVWEARTGPTRPPEQAGAGQGPAEATLLQQRSVVLASLLEGHTSLPLLAV